MKHHTHLLGLLLLALAIGPLAAQQDPDRAIEDTMKQLERQIPGGPLRMPPGRQVNESTTVEAMDRFVAAMVGPTYQREGNRWYFRLAGNEVLVICDPAANRMRIMTPVAETEGLSPNDVVRMLEANFDEALDARYALSGDIVWAVFIHPLAELTQLEFVSAVRQVINLQVNYGSTYTSTDLQFGDSDSESP